MQNAFPLGRGGPHAHEEVHRGPHGLCGNTELGMGEMVSVKVSNSDIVMGTITKNVMFK